MVDQKNGIAVRDQVVHHTCQSDDIGGMKTDGRLVQNIEDSRSPVAHRAGKLHPLPLPGGQCRGCAVQSQISQTKIQQPFCNSLKRLADALCHRTHFLRQGAGDFRYPFR